MDRPTLAGILRTHGSTYRRSHALSPTQARAWRAIVDCRTAALGGVRERCANCGAERHVWRSCRNRHCPQCQTRAKEAWRAARLRDPAAVRLDGDAWLRFLDAGEAPPRFLGGPGELLRDGAFRAHVDDAAVEALRVAARARFLAWMEAHR